MKEVWDLEISRHCPFKEIAKKRYLSNGGKLDRQDCVPYDQYVKTLGKFFFFFCLNLFLPFILYLAKIPHPFLCRYE